MGDRAEVHRIDSNTTMYGVIGDPILHSKSPIMLNRAFREMGVNAAYSAYHVTVGQLGDAIRGFRALSFGGVNVTIPHKLEVMAFLDEIDEDARLIGAVNTIVNREGRLIGYNTDGIGYVRSLLEETGFQAKGKRILMIGAGGAARGVTYALARQEPSVIWIANRTREKAVELAHSLSEYAECQGIGLDELDGVDAVDLIVNNTPSGMHPHIDELPVEEAWIERHIDASVTVSDLIYNPRETKLLRLSAARGARTHSGLGMFIHQGAYAFEYWTGLKAPIQAMRETVEQALL